MFMNFKIWKILKIVTVFPRKTGKLVRKPVRIKNVFRITEKVAYNSRLFSLGYLPELPQRYHSALRLIRQLIAFSTSFSQSLTNNNAPKQRK